MEIALLVVLGLVVVLGIYLWSTYNALVSLNVRVDEAWSDITVQLKRRADLIPNLIETVKGYASHEREVFENVTQARAATVSPQALEHPAQAAQAGWPVDLPALVIMATNYARLVVVEVVCQLQTWQGGLARPLPAQRYCC